MPGFRVAAFCREGVFNIEPDTADYKAALDHRRETSRPSEPSCRVERSGTLGILAGNTIQASGVGSA